MLIITKLIFIFIFLPVSAQQREIIKPFQYLDVAVTAGSTGVGIDFTTPVTDWFSVCVGANYMPRVNIPFKYSFSVGDVNSGSYSDLIGNNQTQFNKMNELMYTITGSKIQRVVHMDRHTMMDNAKILLDFKPLNNKHWHVTTGFYYGSRTFAYGENILDDAVTFTCVAMYNEMWRKAVNNEPLLSSTGQEFPEEIRQKFISYGKAHIYLGKYAHDIKDDQGKIIRRQGESFYIEPDENCEIVADARVNKFRPYLGIGYEGRLKKNDEHLRVGFNLGAMFWGGIPSVIIKLKDQDISTAKTRYHEIDLMTDVTELPSYAQKETDIVNALPVYPVLEFKLSYRIK